MAAGRIQSTKIRSILFGWPGMAIWQPASHGKKPYDLPGAYQESTAEPLGITMACKTRLPRGEPTWPT